MALSKLNASYSVFSYAVRRYAGISPAPPLPPAISVEMTGRCNLACPECVTGTGLIRRENGFMTYELASEIASQMRGNVLSAWLSFQGEPLLHPDFFRIAGLFSGMNPVIATNGHYLDRERCILLAGSPLKRIIISYDGVTQEVYGLYRKGGDLSLVTEGIKLLAATIKERRSELKIVLQFLLHKGNEHEAGAAEIFARSVGAGFRIKSMQVLDPSRAGIWVPSDPAMSRYTRGNDGTWRAAASPGRGCLRMWTSAVITTDGDVVPCCYDKNGKYAMGNLQKADFRQIWRGRLYGSFRDMVMRDRGLVPLCRDCPEGRTIFF
jgi:radical SAM protein with 4Fe4S-binding SPASM domain